MIRNKQTAAAVGAILAGIALGSVSLSGLAAGMQVGGGPNERFPRTDLPIIQVYQDPSLPPQEQPQAGRGSEQRPAAPPRQGGSGRRSGSMGMGSSRSRPARGSGDPGAMGMGGGAPPSFPAPDIPDRGSPFPFGGSAGQWPQGGQSGPPPTGQSESGWAGYPPGGPFSQDQGAVWSSGGVPGPGLEPGGFGGEGYAPPSWPVQPPGGDWRPQSLPGYTGARPGGERLPLESQPEAMGYPPVGGLQPAPMTAYPSPGGVESTIAPGGGQPPVTSYPAHGWTGYPPSEGFGELPPPVSQPTWEESAGQTPGGVQVPETGYAPGNWMGYPPAAGSMAGADGGQFPSQLPSYPPARYMGQRSWGYGGPPPMPFGPPQMGLERAAQIEERLQRIEASLQEILENQRKSLSRE